MNLYFLIEDKGAGKKVYRAWISHLFPHLQEVNRIEDIKSDHFFLLSGKGYPSYINRIPAALADVINHGAIDHLLICVDTEQYAVAEKTKEISEIVLTEPAFSNCHIVVHHCCIETWFLGHKAMLRRHPQSAELRAYKQFFDVSLNDPELMESPPQYVTRAQFHYDYLKEMLREQGLNYTKNRPGPVADRTYLDALIARHIDTGHLQSFGYLIALWKSFGATI